MSEKTDKPEPTVRKGQLNADLSAQEYRERSCGASTTPRSTT
jgi:hypothetical protein